MSELEAERPDSTGHPEVDEVTASLQRLGDLPVGEHVAVFERAHESLRGVLSQAREAPVDDGA